MNRVTSLFRAISPRYYPTVLITAVLVSAQFGMGALEGIDRLAIAIVAAMAVELFLSQYLLKRWPNPASAYISGISVGILIRSLVIWPYALAATLSIMSKYVLRYRGRHLWNPSNFGIVILLLGAPDAVNILSRQWSNSLVAVAVIWAFGLIVVWRANRLHVTLSYALSFVVFAALRSELLGVPFLSELAPLTGPMYQLFIFFMVTDPPTSVSTRQGRIIVAVAVAAVETVLRLMGIVNAPFFALFVVGPLANVIDIWRRDEHVSHESPP
jgi:enediyne biosynthesis protein E5